MARKHRRPPKPADVSPARRASDPSARGVGKERVQPTQRHPTDPLTWLSLALMGLIAAPCLAGSLPSVHWAEDPRSTQGAADALSLGPTSLAWINVLLVLVSAASIAWQGYLGGKVHRWSLVAGIGGMLWAGWHLMADAYGTHRLGQWIAAIAAALAVRHLAGHQIPRRLILAGLLGLLAPMIAQTVGFLWVEHPQTVSHFQTHEQAFLQARGWSEGSPQHLLFERRLRRPDATGWFGLANVFGSVVMGLTVLAGSIALGLASRWARSQGSGSLPRTLAWAALMVGGMAVVYASGSRGAQLALLVGGMLLLAGGIFQRFGRHAWLHAVGPLALALSLAIVLAVVWVGLLGPPKADVLQAGPLTNARISLLFRSHYWQGSLEMLADEPARTITGVGPGAFQALYAQHKSPQSPEDVNSAHNLFIDYVATLGLGGLLWAGLLVGWTLRMGRCVATREALDAADAAEDRSLNAGPGPLALLLSLACLTGPLMVEWQRLLLGELLLLRLMGAVGFFFIASTALRPRTIHRRWVSLGLIAAAVGLLCHNQISLAFVQPGSSGLCWVVLALAGTGWPATSPSPAEPPRWHRLTHGAALAAVGLAMLLGYALPVTFQQSRLVQAKRALQSHRHDPAEALKRSAELLRRAIDHRPANPKIVSWWARLRQERALRLQSVGHHQRAWDLTRQTLTQLEALLDPPVGEASIWGFWRAHQDPRRPDLWRARARLMGYLADFQPPMGPKPTPHDLAQAWARVLQRAPLSLSDHLQAADRCWQAGLRQRASKLYRRCLWLSERAYLDPAKQLTAGQRRRVEARAHYTKSHL